MPTDDLVDAVGHRHQRVTEARIVSLVPSLTELLCELGLADQIVGRTGYCIHPAAEVERIPKVGGTKTVNEAKIQRLGATHLVVNVDENEKPTVERLAASVPHVIVTHPQTLEDNRGLYRLFGAIFGREEAARRLEERLEAACARLRGRAWPARRVIYLIWKDPWMTVAPDTYIGRFLAEVGWAEVELDDARRYPEIDLEAVARPDDLILLSSEPYAFGATDRALLADRLPGCQVIVVDGAMLSWYGSRAIAGIGYLGRLAEEVAAQR